MDMKSRSWKDRIIELSQYTSNKRTGRLSEKFIDLHTSLSNRDKKASEDELIRLILCADEAIAFKALLFAHDLHKFGNPTSDFDKRVSRTLEKIIKEEDFEINSPYMYELIASLETFNVTDAISFLDSFLQNLEQKRVHKQITDEEYDQMIRISWLSFSLLNPSEASRFSPLILNIDEKQNRMHEPGLFGSLLASMIRKQMSLEDLIQLFVPFQNVDTKTRESVYKKIQLALEHQRNYSERGIGHSLSPQEEKELLDHLCQLLELPS
jgi:hypothetical protein